MSANPDLSAADLSAADLSAADPVLLEILAEREEMRLRQPERLFPHFFRRCQVDILLVTDGGLDFGTGDFGLRTFVKTIQSSSSLFVSYRVTLAHRRVRGGDAMLDGDPTITRRITSFRFDDPDHFSAQAYDQLWIFGIEGAPGISDAEVRAVAEFMDAGRGVFATGDHGALGRAMGQRIPRVRSMRLWDSTAGVDEVSMDGFRRNDTNRLGHDGSSQFNDQSDDVPQVITPRMYRSRFGIFEARYPHPVLCGPKGAITVMPDHPHEGECVEPTDLTATVTVGGATFTEYPAATAGGPRPRPEVISTSHVLTGTTSGGKDATQGHTFGGICAYDGHRAGVGRVVTDATWHHFVNVNLIGEVNAPAPKNAGFLASATGQQHLDQIRTYYRNVAVWINPPALIRCLNRRHLWWTVFDDRVVEAVATTSTVTLRDAAPRLLWGIGKQARDVLGRRTNSCQTIRLILDLLPEHLPPQLLERIDPWQPREPRRREVSEAVPLFDPGAVLDMALGGAVVALHERYAGDVDRRVVDEVDEVLDEVVGTGAAVGVERANEVVREAVSETFAVLGLSR